MSQGNFKRHLVFFLFPLCNVSTVSLPTCSQSPASQPRAYITHDTSCRRRRRVRCRSDWHYLSLHENCATGTPGLRRLSVAKLHFM